MNIKQLFLNNRKKILSYFFLFILALSSFIFFQYNRASVFPEINIEMKIDKYQAETKSEEFLKNLGINTNLYKKVTVFSDAPITKNYLEKNIAPKEAGKIMNEKIDTWDFNTRFFIPFEQEEFEVSFDNLGRFSYYLHTIPDNKEGVKIEENTAITIAENFIKKYHHEDLSQFDLIEKDFEDKVNRRDYYLTWEDKNFNINNAKKRIFVAVGGDQVLEFNTFLKIPDQWSRDEEKAYSHNETAQTVAEVLSFLLISIPMIFIFIKKFKHKQLHYKTALWVAIITAIIALLETISIIPEILYNYNTLDTWTNFLAESIFEIILVPVVYGFGTWLLILVVESFFREANPNESALINLFKKSFFQQKKYAEALFVGFLSGFIATTYQIIYYFLGKKIGFWVPVEITSQNAFSGYLPWILILSMGLIPAISEEVTFRLFGISFFKKYLKKTWLAVLLSSVIWSFLHSAYDQQPFYARGIELIPVGIFFSYLYLRHGILSSISAHFTFNAFLTLQFLVKNNTANQATAISLFLLPLILTITIIIVKLKTKQSQTEEAETNLKLTEKIANTKSEQNEKPATTLQYEYLGKKTQISFLIIIFVALFIYIFHPLKFKPDDLDRIKTEKNRTEIINLSDNYLKEKGVDINQYKKVATIYSTFSDTDKDYLLDQKDGFEKLKAIHNKIFPAYLWEVRYFKPMEEEEYYVETLTNGNLYNISHYIPETKDGASLSKEEAQKISDDYLKTRQDIIFSNQELIEAIENKKDKRMDYSITYKDKSFDLGEGHIKTVIKISDNEITGFFQYLDIPESWARDKSKSTIKDFILGIVIFIPTLFFIIYTVISFLRINRNKLIKWKESLIIVAIAAIITIVDNLNSLTTYYSSYDGIESLNIFHAKNILVFFIGLISLFLILWLTISFAIALIKENVINPLIPADPEHRKKIIGQAIYLAYGFLASLSPIAILSEKVMNFLSDKYDLQKQLLSLPGIDSSIQNYFPALTNINSNIMAFIMLPTSFIPIIILYRYFKKWKFVWVTIFLYATIAMLSISDNKEMVLAISALSTIMIIIIPFCLIIKKNILSIPIFFYITMMAPKYIDNIQWFYSINNLTILFGFFLPIIVYFVFYKIKPIARQKT